ncbi:glycoside hydrolase family 127 protein [Geofilum rubicundum]|uniref:Glycosyl hydrolase n=1 Tax=Geofilum rubicundum JCM 15548 TaxID=1236989 RepID=A0A0E9LYL5_9BACT|nr:glycoside hydrolase family 127 protein [Geofilum rubicundum]GAO30231.1 glycosyl hydrolase [Geofilum rubicundum JCM 15548]
MKKSFFTPIVFSILLQSLAGCNDKTTETSSSPQAFPLSAVKLLDSPFLHASKVNSEYVMAHDPDRLLAPFLIDAGLEPKAPRYGNWENTGLDGHTAGHYLTSLALMVASEDHEEARERLDYMIEELALCQAANGNGYVGGIPGGKAMWEEIAKGQINAGGFSLNGKWVPLYNIHKLFAGLYDAWFYTGHQQALDILTDLSDYFVEVCSQLTDEQMQQMLISEHGGMNDALANVYAVTNNPKHLELARRMSHHTLLNPLLEHKDQLTGMHANTQIPKVIGFMRIAELTGDSAWHSAAQFFWETVVKNRSVAIGGNSTHEYFHPADDFSSMIETREGPETCNTYNMMKLSKQLYHNSNDLQYIDYYERAMYNHILSSQHPTHGGLVYFTPMRPQHYRVYSNPEETFWCCVGSGIENHAKYGELIYAHDANNLYVNLFIPSEVRWEEKGLTLTQSTLFPENNQTLFTVNTTAPTQMTLFIRHPKWNDHKALSVTINGETVKAKSEPGTYLALNREWQNNDQVEVTLDTYTYGEYLPDESPYLALMHGPLVLAAPVGNEDTDGLIADDSRMGHIAHGKLISRKEAPVLITDDQNWSDQVLAIDGEALTFSTGDLLYPESARDLKLIPFYKIHDQRYILYWNTTSTEELALQQQLLKEQEEAAMALEAETIDRIDTGQQQPESDHNFQSEKSEAGIHQNRHWRHASGWFSYDLNDPQAEAAKLRITYFGGDANRSFDILLNDEVLAAVQLDGSKGNTFYEVDYTIPENIKALNQNGKMKLTFKAHDNSIAGGVYFIRLMR